MLFALCHGPRCKTAVYDAAYSVPILHGLIGGMADFRRFVVGSEREVGRILTSMTVMPLGQTPSLLVLHDHLTLV